jgi:hypothetical protein
MTAWGIGSIAAPAGRTGVAACSAGESGERAPPAYGGTRAGFCRFGVRLLGVATGEGGRGFSQTIASDSPDLRLIAVGDEKYERESALRRPYEAHLRLAATAWHGRRCLNPDS